MKLIVVIMGQDCEDTIGMCLESVKTADSIVYCDGGSTDRTLEIITKNKSYNINPCRNKECVFTVGLPCCAKHDEERISGVKKDRKYRQNFIEIIENKYNQEDKGMNGKQRNFYLNYLKENYPEDWCLVLDADEVLEDFGIEKIRHIISNEKSSGIIFSPRIHHFIGDIGHEDYTKETHYVPNRLFKINEFLEYPEVEHPVLQSTIVRAKDVDLLWGFSSVDVHIWHLRECLGIFNTQKKHENNTNKSNMHNKEYLDWWHKSMLFGNYPKKVVYYGNIPTPIKKRFGI